MRLASPGSRAGAPAGGISSEANLHSLVLALDYRVDDVERTWSLIRDNHSPLIGLGARHAVLYTSTLEPDRVLVTIGLRHRASIKELLRSPAVFEWFDRTGVNDLPAIFAGEVLEKINMDGSPADSAAGGIATGVIVGAVSTVADPADLMARVHSSLDRFADAGVRKVWVYRAVDDGREVMTLLEIDGAASARRWIDCPDTAAEWMSSVGLGGYSRPFVGKLTAVIDLMNDEATRQG